MNIYLPPLVTPLVEEPMATGGVQTLPSLRKCCSGDAESNRAELKHRT